MKLRNKKTGEIGKPAFIGVDYEITILPEDKNKKARYYNSLAELNAEWEDYEEPKEYWYINTEMYEVDYYEKGKYYDIEKFNKEIGNYFETEEEAEKTVKRLRAWKRLKDKGFRFTLTPATGSLDITPGKFQIEINAEMPEKWFCCDAVQKDLDDCFGGEE
jgi:protein involved in sex pheromone biosynthesis